MQQNPFSSIDTFIKENVRTVLQESDYQGTDSNGDPVFEHTKDYPIITYSATHKVGGTNTSIVKKNGEYFFQSRNNLLIEGTNTPDQNGFRNFMENNAPEGDPDNMAVELLFFDISEHYNLKNTDEIIVYGEWCGSGIKDNHSISQSEQKQWIIFAIKINGEYVENFKWFECEKYRIYNILKWGSFEITIDYNQFEFGCWGDSNKLPDDLQELANKHTLLCPVSKFFGVDGKGEGLVLKSVNYVSSRTGKPLIVKIKNSEYDRVNTKVKTQNIFSNDPVVDKFVINCITTARLGQFINFMINEGKTIEMKNVSYYQTLILNDVIKECQNELNDSKLTIKMIEKEVRKMATEYFKSNIK
jgi:hypothetical protein